MNLSIGLGILGLVSVLLGVLVAYAGPAIARWIDSRAELNRAKARELEKNS